MDLLVFGMMVLFYSLFFIAVAKFKKEEEEQKESKGRKREVNKTFHTMSHVND